MGGVVGQEMSAGLSISVDEARARLGDLSFVDIREQAERDTGYIEGSTHIPMSVLLEDPPDSGTILYCASGQRSGVAAALLSADGVEGIVSMEGGINAWVEAELPVISPSTLTSDQLDRYGRHVNLPGVGVEGQARLLDGSVAVVGAGGLGSPVLLYLAAAGVGTLGVIDDDNVDASNLQRQIIHDLENVGRPKADSARERIVGLNPDVKVEHHRVRLNAANALDLLHGYDVVVDATDNFPTRYLINDASLRLRIPVVHASIYRFEGQLSVFKPYEGPCYRCLFPTPPPPELAANCDIGGVIGVLPGIVGTLQAAEALKLVIGVGEPLVGRLMLYDGLVQETSEVRFHRDPKCRACGDESEPPTLIDYDDACLPG